MRNSRLLPYETTVQAASGEPEAVNTILQHYRRHIYFSAFVNGQFNPDAEGLHHTNAACRNLQIPF